MDNIVNWALAHPILSVAMSAFVCGVALFYLVMRRTMKHRE